MILIIWKNIAYVWQSLVPITLILYNILLLITWLMCTLWLIGKLHYFTASKEKAREARQGAKMSVSCSRCGRTQFSGDKLIYTQRREYMTECNRSTFAFSGSHPFTHRQIAWKRRGSVGGSYMVVSVFPV